MTHQGTNRNGEPYFRQIDYILCRKHQKGLLTNCRTYAQRVNSDHRLLIARLQLTKYYALEAVQRKKTQSKRNRYDVERLNDPTVKIKYKNALEEKVETLIAQGKQIPSAKTAYDTLLNSIKEAAKETVGIIDNTSKGKGRKKFEDEEIRELSEKQHKLRTEILSCRNAEKKKEMKTQRNQLLRAIKKRTKMLTAKTLEAKVREISTCKDNAKMFQAIKMARDHGIPRQKLFVNDAKGERITNEIKAADFVRKHFVSQFSDVHKVTIEAHPESPRPLQKPIEDWQVKAAIKKLKNRRAVGLDGICAELVKNGPDVIHGIIATIINKAMETGEDLELGLAKLVTLPKPGKSLGPVKNIRPIALLPLLRKILSLITLARIRDPVNCFLSQSHSAYRVGRSTADIVWAHRWLVAKALRYKTQIHILGLDMSRALNAD